MNRQKLLLLVLVALLAAAIAYAIFASPRQERVPAQTGKQSARPRPETRGKETGSAFGPSVRLELLEKEKVKFPGVRRDLFGTLFVEKPPAPPPPPPPPSSRLLPLRPRWTWCGRNWPGSPSSDF